MKIKNKKSIAFKEIALLLLICNLYTATFSQNIEEQIDNLINATNYEEAIQLSKTLLEEQPDNPEYNFKVGYCYMNTPLKKAQAIPYLLKASEIYREKNDQSANSIETKFYLGMAYHKNYEFKKALEIFELMQQQVKNKEILNAINEEIEQCKNGTELMNKPVNMQVTNIGNTINTPFSDHSPVVSADESVIIFTSRRKRYEDEQSRDDGQYNEDIYISTFEGQNWSQPKSIGSNINTDAHEASIGISADGQELLIYNEKDGGTILLSRLIGDEWSVPEDLGGNINTRSRETHASISSDGKYLYFTSDRPGGYGGLDIYVSEKNDNGTWGKAVNLGPTINTDKDEEGPFIHHDGVTLYFSSKGHTSMGGFDIFMSKKNEFDTWTLPENMGYPVNTVEDDAFFVMTADGKRAYYASYRENGVGCTDIYLMGLPEAEEKPLTVVKGIVGTCKSEIDKVKIIVYDLDTKEIIGQYKPNSKTGKYLFILTRGKKYKAVYEVAGREIHNEDFNIGEDADFQVLYKTIELKTGTPCREYVGIETDSATIAYYSDPNVGEDPNMVYIENIMFKINNAEVTYFKENLDKLSNYLKEHPDTKIELVGYCDTQGPESYNLKLSGRRAKEVNQYLLSHGVKQEQLVYRGDGEKNQITINNYKDGSYIWQSLPYNRRVEFNIISDKDNKLVIKQFRIPKVYCINQDENTSNLDSDYDKKFTIQVGAYSKPISTTHFKNLKNVQMYFTGNYYHYSYGEFETEDAAVNELKVVCDLGYKDAFIRPISFYFPDKLKSN